MVIWWYWVGLWGYSEKQEWRIRWITSTITCSRSCWSGTRVLENPIYSPGSLATSSVWSLNPPLVSNSPRGLSRLVSMSVNSDTFCQIITSFVYYSSIWIFGSISLQFSNKNTSVRIACSSSDTTECHMRTRYHSSRWKEARYRYSRLITLMNQQEEIRETLDK